MILIKPCVYKVIDDYTRYLINEGLTSQQRAMEKKNILLQALRHNLGGIRSFPFSRYESFGAPQGYRLYVYKDPKSKTQWGFTHREFENGNNAVDVIVYGMRNMKLVDAQCSTHSAPNIK